MNKRTPPRQSYKAMLWDYDSLLNYSEDECCFSLSAREIQILLAQLEYIGWKTRYIPTDTSIDQNEIDRWRDNLARKLMSGCCPDEGKIYRFTEDGELESSVDGGETWTPSPEDDPRLTAPLFPPLPGEPGATKKCIAANNTVGAIKAQADAMSDDIAAWGSLTLLIAAVLGILAFLSILGSGGLLTPLVVGLAGTLLGAGRAAFIAAMTIEVYETLCCILYCNMQEDGTYTQANIDAIKTEIEDQLTGVAATYLRDTIGLLGVTGLTNASTTSASDFDFDCSACECVPYCESADSWFAGTVNSVTDNMDGSTTFNVSSVDNGGGVQYIAWGDRINADAPCCEFDGVTGIPGTLGGAVQLCGSAEEFLIVPTGGNCYHYFHIYQDSALATPFTADVRFVNCEE